MGGCLTGHVHEDVHEVEITGGPNKEVPMRTRWAGFTLFMLFSTTACATTTAGPKTEDLLSQAGFRKLPADTPQKVAHMQTLPDKRLVSRTYQGKKYYVYSGPEGCKCVYIGDPAQYQSDQSIARQQQQTAPDWQPQQGVEEAREWEIENSGR